MDDILVLFGCLSANADVFDYCVFHTFVAVFNFFVDESGEDNADDESGEDNADDESGEDNADE